MREGTALIVVLACALGPGCGPADDDMDADTPVDGAVDGEVPEDGAPPPDGSTVDGGPPCPGGCGECEQCAGGACVPIADGIWCEGGSCRDGVCCGGCWDEDRCRPGDELAACGAAGSLCAECRCDGDACMDGQCQPEVEVVGTSAGGGHTCAVLADGTLWCWGRSESGELGVGEVGGAREVPARVGTAEDWVAVAAGGAHTCGLRADKSLWCWGSNTHGQLGTGVFGEGTERGEPVRIDGGFQTISAGGLHTCGIRTDGELSCWGAGEWGQHGLGSNDPAPTPAPVEPDAWTSVAAGVDHTCALAEDGAPWCWGRNTDYQLGLGTAGLSSGRNEPAPVSAETDWLTLTAGREHTCALRGIGTLWCWGRNRLGELGTGDTARRRVPWRTGSTSWADIAAGWIHTCGVTMGNDLLCWGEGDDGRLGTGDTADRLSPTTVDIAPYWSDVEAGQRHTCAIQTTGALFCWGSGADGRLGDGSLETRRSPVRVCPE